MGRGTHPTPAVTASRQKQEGTPDHLVHDHIGVLDRRRAPPARRGHAGEEQITTAAPEPQPAAGAAARTAEGNRGARP